MVAGSNPATRTAHSRCGAMPRRWVGAAWPRTRGAFAVAIAASVLTVSSPAPAASNNVQITKLSDITFGPISNLGADTTRSENVCIFSGTATNGYNVKATGSGSNNAFTLATGTQRLAYDVQWNSSSGQTVGSSLTPNSTLGGLTSTAKNATCSGNPSTTASLIVIIRSAAASSAIAGDYSGTLTLVFGPE
jgi:hypothetical protein